MRHLKILPFILMLSLLGVLPAFGATTIEKTMTEIVSANGYTVSSGSSATCYTSFSLDANITVSTSGSANCGSFWGSSTQDWRLYQNKSGDITISAASGYELSKITITYSVSNTGTLKDGSTTIASGSEQTVSGTSKTYTVGNTNTSTTNGQVKVTKIKVVYNSSSGTKTLSSVAVSGTPTKKTYYAGDVFEPAGLTVTGTYSDNSTAPITSGITWTACKTENGTFVALDNAAVALAKDETDIYVKATVSEKTSGAFHVTGLTVTEAPAADNYELVTDVSDLEDATEIIIVNIDENKALSTNQQTNNRAGVAVSSTNHVIPVGSDVQIITLEASSTNWKFKVGTDSYLYASSGSSNQLKTTTATTAGDNGVWAIAIANDGAATIIAQGSNTRNNLRYNPNSGSPIFCCYASTSTMGLVKIFKKSDGTSKQAAGLAYDAADAEKSVILGETFTAPTLTNPHSLTVSYESDNTDVAEVANNGSVTIKATGKAVITASFAGNDDYKAGSASYTIIVTNHAGTAADPYSVADARTVIDAGIGLADKYVHGFVSAIVEALNTTYHNMSYNISDDGLTTSNQLEAYRGKSYNGGNFTSNDDIQVGDEVVVSGTLKKYNSTYELDAENQLVKRSAHLSWSGTSASSFQAELNGTNTFPTLVNADNVTASYSSSNGDAATIDASTGTITLVAVGNTTITATFAGNNDFFTKSASYTLVVESSVLKADISFECNGATSGCPATGLTDQTNLPDELPVLAKNGKNFGGWFMDSEFNTPAVAGAAVTSADPITLYAKWLDPYSVTQALTIIDALADGAQTESSVYVAGIVSTAPTAAPNSNGQLTFYISVNGEAENQLQAFNCKNLNNESFTAQTDIQVGDEVTVFGPLKKYMKSGNPVPEFNTGYLYAFNHPSVAVTGIDLTESTAEVEEGETVTLHAAVVPGNASDKEIVWSVQSGNDKASVNQSGVVTGVAAGTAVIRAASHEDATIYEECTVTVTAADPTKKTVTFDATVDKGESPLSKDNITFTCSNGVLNNESEYRLYKNSENTFACSTGNITKIEFTGVSGNPISGFANPEVGTLATEGNDGVWTGNAASVTFVASGAQVRASLIKVTYKEDSRAESGLAWNPAGDIEITVGDAFTPRTLLNPNNIAAAEISIESDNTDLATVSEGVVSLVANATGTATITATFAGNTTYKPATVSYKITVNEVNVTFDATVDVAAASELSITKGGFTLEFTGGAMDNGSEYRLYKSQTMTLSSTDYLIKKIEFTCTSGNPITGFADATGLDKDNNQWTGESNTVELIASNKQVQITKIKVFYIEDPRAASGLAWSTDEVELSLGETFVAANLVNPNSIAAGEITITSSNTNLATVTAGVVELVDDVIGTATITATFAGNATYKPASVSYSITVLDPTPAIITDPSNKLDWGTVNKGTIPTDKKIAVTLHFLSSVDADLDDQDGVFNIDKYSNIVDGDVITVSVVNTTTVGTYSATLTLSNDDGFAPDKEITLSVKIEDPETPVSTTSKWVVAGAVADGDVVLLTGVKSDKTYALSTQGGNNRTAAEGSLSEGIFTPGANTMSVTLVEQSTGKYALRTSNGKYLYAASSGSNYMKTRDAIGDDGAAVWTITIDDNNEASVVANCETTNWRNVMQFNSNSTLFSCYASASQQPIKLYVRKYAVIISSTIENGTVTASPSLTDAGETVTLTATADPDYMLKSISVRTEVGGSIVSILNNTFTMPAENVVVNATFEHIPTLTYYLKNNWDGCDATWEAMTKDGDNYKLENVIYGGSGIYYNDKADDDGAVFKPYADIKYLDGATAKVVEAYDTVNFVLDPANGTILAEMLNKDTVVTYTVAGNSLALFDLGWAATHPYKYTDMKKQTDGNYKWDNGGRSVVLPAGNVEIKVVKSRDYANGSWPAEPFVYTIKESGEFMINIYYNPCSHDIWIDTTLVEPLNIQSLSIKGSWDNWSTVKPFTLGSENDKALVTLSLTAGTPYQFKLQDGQDKYYGDGFTFTRDNISHQGIEAHEEAAAVNMTINVDKTGEYLFTYFFDTEQLLVQYPAIVPAEKIAPLSGKFTINQNGDTAVFSRGNLHYNYEANEWYAAEKQYEVLGDLNLRFGDNTYQGSIDLFGWSCESSDFGKQWKYKDEEFSGAFVDWGTLFAADEKEWSTLSEAEWTFIMNRKKGNNKLWTMIAIGPDSLNGLALIPDDWTAPACASNLVYGFYNVDDKVNYKKNAFTFEQWADLEASGIVFIPLAGTRAGYYGNNWSGSAVSTLDNPIGSGYDWVDNMNWMGYYWLSTSNTTTQAATAILPGWHDNKWNVPTIWKREKRRGQPVRLVTRIPAKEVVRANLTNGKWGTICPKQNVENVEGAAFYQIAYLEEQNGVPFNMVWDEISGTTLTAGQPYFFIANATAIRGYKTGDAVTSGSHVNGFYGYIGDENLDLPNWHINYEPGHDNTFVIYNNKVTRIDGATELYSERCYININSTEPTRQVKPQQSAALHRLVMGISGADAPAVTTGIDQMVNGKCQNGKLIIDGHLFIIRGEKMFDATGRLVK